MTNIVDMQVPASSNSGKRTTFGLDIRVGAIRLNEWGVQESIAKTAHEKLVKRGDKPFTLKTSETLEDGTVRDSYMTFSRRESSELAALLAEVEVDAAPAK